MDSRSFDRLARLLGGATDRRAGLKAALGALLAGGLAAQADARDKGRGKERDAKWGDGAADAAPPGGDLDAAKKKRRCKPIGGRCKKQKHCCTGTCVKPTNAKGKPAKKGDCRCNAEGAACLATADCCADGTSLQCVQGVCSRLPVPTGQPCAEGDTCADPDAACTFHRREDERTAATLCLVGGGGACVKDHDCIDLVCTGGRCTGRTVIATGDACVPGQSICRALGAICARYQSAVAPDGHFCLLPDGDACAGDGECRDYACQDGFCGRKPVDTGAPCNRLIDTCRDHRATCTTYASGDAQTRCLLGDGETCAAAGQCIVQDCREGICQGGPRLVATGDACSTDPAVDRCLDVHATCSPYRAGSGGPAGTHCVLPEGQSCELPNACEIFSCQQETCAPMPIATGDRCREDLDVCAAIDASCTVYDDADDPETRCLVGAGGACGANADCANRNCERGICTDILPAACDVCATGCAYATIQEAIVGAPDGATITIAPGTYVEDLRIGDKSLALVECDGPVTVVATGRAANVLTVTVGTATARTLGLEGIRFEGGPVSISGQSDANRLGVSIRNCVFQAPNQTQRLWFVDALVARSEFLGCTLFTAYPPVNAGSITLRDTLFDGAGSSNIRALDLPALPGTVVTLDGTEVRGYVTNLIGTIKTLGGMTLNLTGFTRIWANSTSNAAGGGGLGIDGGTLNIGPQVRITENSAPRGSGSGIAAGNGAAVNGATTSTVFDNLVTGTGEINDPQCKGSDGSSCIAG